MSAVAIVKSTVSSNHMFQFRPSTANPIKAMLAVIRIPVVWI